MYWILLIKGKVIKDVLDGYVYPLPLALPE